MRDLIEDDLTRAGTFFALTLTVAVVGGVALGDVRLGIEIGVPLGLVFAVFAYFFVKPTASDDPDDA